MPLGGQLYCLAEVSGEIRLLVLDPQRPNQPVWSQPLVSASLPIHQDVGRRLAGTTASYADGIMVCPTGAGYVIAVVASMRRLAVALLKDKRFEEGVAMMAMAYRTDALLARYYRSLRLWHFSNPPVWTFTDRATSPLALDCQNIDSTVPFEDFARIFEEALEGRRDG